MMQFGEKSLSPLLLKGLCMVCVLVSSFKISFIFNFPLTEEKPLCIVTRKRINEYRQK